MPRAPRYQPNQVRQSSTSGARFRAADNGGGAFGALGAGLQDLGEAGNRFAVVQDRINAENDDTQSRKLVANANVELDKIATEYSLLSAGDAREQQAVFAERADAVRNGALEAASNDRMRGYTEERLIAPHGQTVSRIAGHALREAKAERVTAFQVQEQSLVQNAIGADSPGLRDQYIGEAVAVRFERLDEEGYNPEDHAELFALEGRKVSSAVHDKVLDRKLAVPEPDVDDIFGYIEAYSDEMLEETISVHLARIQSPLQQRSARAGADMVMAALGGVDIEVGAVNVVRPVDGEIHANGRFHSDRDGGARQHRAVDFPAAEGTPIYSAKPGKVTKVVPMDGASGNWVEVTHPDGTSSTYSHMQGFDVERGDVVAAGAQLGRVGSTGAGSGSHLHWVTRDANGNRVDPETWLGEAGKAPYTNAPREWDRAAAEAQLADVAKREGWNPEQVERVRNEIDRRIQRDEGLMRDSQDQAYEAAQETVLSLGDGFTSVNMIPSEVWGSLSVAQRSTLTRAAAANVKSTKPEANSASFLELRLHRARGTLDEVDLTQYIGKITNAELGTMAEAQAKIDAKGDDDGWSPRTKITSAISFGKKISNVELDDEEWVSVYEIMDGRARALKAQKGDLTDDDYQAIFQFAIEEKKMVGGGLFGTGFLADDSKRRFEIGVDNIDEGKRKQIVSALRNVHGPNYEPSDEEILTVWRRHFSQ